MKFDANELYEIAIKVYREEDFLFEGERGYSQREGIGEWAYESAKENLIMNGVCRRHTPFSF